MVKHACDRCHEEADIPTDNFIKFDGEVQYVCGDRRGAGCFGDYLRWRLGVEAGYLSELARVEGRTREEAFNRWATANGIPTYQFVKDTEGVHYMKYGDWENFRRWWRRQGNWEPSGEVH